MKFDELGLGPKVLQAVKEAGYETPTPIQAEAIPKALQARDILGIAQTGTGKTASFTLPMIDILSRGRARARMPRSLILEPTRELAAQVAENFETYGKYHKLSMALLIGGVSFADQGKKLDRGVDVLIATPGRLLDHFERGKVLLGGVQLFVVDEADRMMDMGFIPDLERICKLLPFTRQTLFFSATMPPEIQRLTDTFLTNPVRIEVARTASTANNITQGLVYSHKDDKRETLRHIIRSQEHFKNAIIFCNRKRDVAVLDKSMQKHGFAAGSLHGDLDQHIRMQTLDKFRNGEITYLIASDVAARGLDIPDVSHVFNFDVPIHAEDYVHRIGRTGRAGKSGHAFTIATPEEQKHVAAIEKLIETEIPRVTEFEPEDIETLLKEGSKKRGRGAAAKKPARKKAAPKAKEEAPEAKADAPDADPKASVAKPERKPRRSRKPKAESTAAQEAAPAPAEEKKPAAKSAKDEPKPRNKRGGGKRGDGGGDNNVTGLGDHTPAFLLRPVRKTANG
ncbi:DEAD/DEAH box helicase [Tepidicaulis sp. LMO-SS28]|uniref:DEAD/DEAH box helicase n=1 Tax=Tepidicaulis sp. LMO-SS28 TaxID=3447455 RepID=UPI003EDEBF80